MKLDSLSSTVSQLNSSVLDLQEALSNISTLCGGNPTCLSLVPQSQQIMLEFNEKVSLSQKYVGDCNQQLYIRERVFEGEKSDVELAV